MKVLFSLDHLDIICKVAHTSQQTRNIDELIKWCININVLHLYNVSQRLRRWPTLYKCFTNVLCLLGLTDRSPNNWCKTIKYLIIAYDEGTHLIYTRPPPPPPSEHDTLAKYLNISVHPPPPHIDTALITISLVAVSQQTKKRWTNAGLPLSQDCRRWTNFRKTLNPRLTSSRKHLQLWHTSWHTHYW